MTANCYLADNEQQTIHIFFSWILDTISISIDIQNRQHYPFMILQILDTNEAQF